MRESTSSTPPTSTTRGARRRSSALRGERESLVIATKCFNPTGADINARGSSRRHVSRALEASLKRLGTDRIEILYLHHYDALTPLEEQMRALEDLVRAGKVLYPAVSNFAAWQTQAALGVQERGWGAAAGNPADVQPGEAPGRGRAPSHGGHQRVIGVPYSPGRGRVALGKIFDNHTGRLTTNKMYQARYGEGWVHETAARFAGFCRERNLHPMSAAVAGRLPSRGHRADIGARSVEQLRASLDSVKIDMTPALRAEIAAFSRTPPPATDRLEEASR